MTRTNIYNLWNVMRDRCKNPKNKSFKDYGGRGISVCDRWQTFDNFFADMGMPPPGMMLERTDNDKGYDPDNCSWATRTQQNKNKRNIVFVLYQGKIMCAADACRALNIARGTPTKLSKRRNISLQAAIDHYALHGQRIVKKRKN